MGDILPHNPVLLLLCAFSRSGDALDWARETGQQQFGPVVLESERFEFRETDYYEPTMGANLQKVFYAFQQPFDPADLSQLKRRTNAWEDSYKNEIATEAVDSRPLNLDPGYLSEGKLVLASTKDHAHRIYLSDGIFAEVTLHYQNRQWQFRPWTFPDYRRADYHAFFDRCREYIRQHRRSDPQWYQPLDG